MFRVIRLKVDPNTVETSPATKPIQLTKGRITHWWVGFPPGCHDLVKVTVYEFEHQILPRGEDEEIYWNNYVYSIPDSYPLVEEPYEIEVRAWNEDDTYDHTVVVGVALEPIEKETLMDLMRGFMRTMVGEG